MNEPTKRDEEVYALLLSNRGRVTDLAAYREELLAASAQSPEPEEAEAPSVDDIGRVEGAIDCYAKLYKEPAAQWSWRRIKSALRVRLASKPSRSEAVDDLPIPAARIDDFAGMKVYVSPLIPDGVIFTSRKELAERLARPSREEGMRTVLAEIERYARASLCDHRGGSPDVGSCPNCKSYLHIIELARAALAQGGARDEAQNV